jgi:hypothetical protein
MMINSVSRRWRITALVAAGLMVSTSVVSWANNETNFERAIATFTGGESRSTASAAESQQSSDSVTNVVLDPNAGGSNEVVYPDPSEPEQPVSGKPDAPANLRLTSIGDTSVTARFDTIASIDTYSAYIRYGDSYTQKGLGSDATVTFTELTPDWDYVLCVSYRVGDVESNRACVDVHTTGSRPVEPERPAAPANLQLSATQTTVTASWDPVEGAAWYSVCHVSGDMSWHCGGYTQLSATSAIFDDGSINPATRYGITVETVRADGSRSDRTVRFITTPGTPPPPPSKYAAPTNLRITEISTTSVTVAWDYPASTPVSVWAFTVRRETSYSSTGVSGSARSFTYNGLTPGLGYEIILDGRDVNNKYTEVARLGFYAPTQ